MPKRIRSPIESSSESTNSSPMDIYIDVLAVRHIRAYQTKCISKVNIKVTIINKHKFNEKQSLSGNYF